MKISITGVRARLRELLFRRTAEREMEDELRFHIDMEARRLVEHGMPPREARRSALVTFGGLDRTREQLRDGRRLPVLEPLAQDLRFGARLLRRAPGLSLVAVVTIALGVGATTTVFSATNALLLRPLAFAGADRIASIQESRSGMVSTGIEGMLIPYSRYLEYRAGTAELFAGLAAHRLEYGFSLRLDDVTVGIGGALTSGNYFEALGVRPVVGRAYTSDDAAEIVISHDLWTTRFGRDPAVIGRTVGLDGRRMTIVGVTPAGFGGPTVVASSLWAPVGLRGAAGDRWDTRVVPVGRLRDGVSFEAAEPVVSAMAARLPSREQETTVRGARLDRAAMVSGDARLPVLGFFGLLLGMAVLVLLIAGANIAGVMLARGFARGRELAIRLAIGAGRARIVRHLLAESLVLFAIGGALGVWLAYAGTSALARLPLPPQLPALSLNFGPDTRVLVFAVALTGVAGLIFGLVPALRTSRPDLLSALKTGTAGAIGGEGRARGIFVVCQVAFAVALLLTATLFARSLQRGLRTDIGFEPEGLVAASIDLGPPHDYGAERSQAFHAALLERVRALPGVQSAALTQYVQLSGSRSGGGVSRPDRPDVHVNASYSTVGVGYFETAGIELIAGRPFTEADVAGAPAVVIINWTLAERLWPGENPIGQRLAAFGREPAEVIGVTEAGRYTFVTETPEGFVYQPVRQIHRSAMSVIARAPGWEAETLRALAEIVRTLDPDVAITMPVRVPDLVATSLLPHRVAAQFVGAFGLLGLLLASLGIYGVLSYEVTRHTRELGIRRALGASTSRVVGGVIRRGAALAAIGCGIGAVLGAAVGFAARGWLVGIRPLDPVTFTLMPSLLFAVALLSGWIPAARAGAVHPADALRSD